MAASPMSRKLLPAFTLIEVLAVMVIVVLMATLTVPAIRSITRSTSLNSSVHQVVGMMEQARQMAIAQNRKVEVRLYKYAVPGDSKADYCAIQLFLVDYDTVAPAGKTEKFTNPAIIASDPEVSTLLDDQLAPEKPAAAGISLPSVGQNYSFRSIFFKADGSAEWPGDQECSLTLVNKLDPVSGGILPRNFATIRLDPITGRLTVKRP